MSDCAVPFPGGLSADHCPFSPDDSTFEVFEKTSTLTAPSSVVHSPAASINNGSSENQSPKHRLSNSSLSSSLSSPSDPLSSLSQPERSLLITVSEGAHSSNILSIDLDARHSIHPLPRRPLTQHIELSEALRKLSAHSLHVQDNDLLARGQIEGAAVFFGEKEAESEHGLLPVQKASSSVSSPGGGAGPTASGMTSLAGSRRGSIETDRGSVRSGSAG